jgi:hypothetical protein
MMKFTNYQIRVIHNALLRSLEFWRGEMTALNSRLVPTRSPDYEQRVQAETKLIQRQISRVEKIIEFIKDEQVRKLRQK